MIMRQRVAPFEGCLRGVRAGRSVGEAADAPGAVRKTAELKPDVVILDLILGMDNGLTAAREISRATPTTPHRLPGHCRICSEAREILLKTRKHRESSSLKNRIQCSS